MSIFEEKRKGKPTGRIIVEVQVGGRTYRQYTTDRREAKKMEARLKAGILPNESDPQGYTLGDLLNVTEGELWRGQKDQKNSERRFRKCVELIGSERTLASLKTTDIDNLIRELRKLPRKLPRTHNKKRNDVIAREFRNRPGAAIHEKEPPKVGVSGATVNRYLAALSGALEWAAKRSDATGFTQRLHIDWQEEGEGKTVWLDPIEEERVVEKLLEGGRDDVAMLVRVLTATGCRIGEILKLTPDQVFDDMIYLEDRKNGDDAYQPLPEHLCGQLRTWLEDEDRRGYRSILDSFQRAVKQAGINKKIGLHGLRHSVGTRLAMAGVDLEAIRDVLGHSSSETTRRYRHAAMSVKKRALSTLLKQGA